MIDFVPKLSDETLDDAVKAARERVQVKQGVNRLEEGGDVNLMTVTGEYIFLMDESTFSSKDIRVHMAKKALVITLKSLPPNSYFNVYSFGSTLKSLFKNSVESTENNVEDAIKEVNNEFSGCQEETNIFEALLRAMKEPRKNYPRSIFLLTTGAANEEIIATIVAENSQNRIFALIGSGCSTEFIQSCADRGRGKAAFVSNLRDISGIVISLMEATMVPVCDDFSLEYSDKSMVMMVAPESSAQNYLLRNERTTFFVFLCNEAVDKDRFFDISLRYFDSHTNDHTTTTLKVDLKNYEMSLDVFKLGIWKVAEGLERQEAGLPSEIPDVYWAGKVSISEKIAKLSVTNQVLTKKTAFVCIVKKNSKDEIDGLKQVREIEPQIFHASQRDQSYLLERMKERPGGSVLQSQSQRQDQELGKLIPNKKITCVSEGYNQLASMSSEIKASEFGSFSGIRACKDEFDECEESGESEGIEDDFFEVIKQQKMRGYWEPTPELFERIAVDLKYLLSKMPESVRKAKGGCIENIAVTIIVLVWLEKYHHDKKATWAMIHKKGRQWLGAQGAKYAEVAPLIAFE